VILLIFGVDFALLWGFLAFLLNFIPNIGSIVAVILPILIALLQFDSASTALILLVLLMTTQMIMGNVIEPKMMSFSLDLSPLLVLVALIFWGWIWGIWGMILAVPIMSILKIVFENVEALKPIGIVMSGKVPGKK
jgi:predicted PurR-regulated permease PerM